MGTGAGSPPPSSFGDLLRRHRQAAGLSQEQLAERAALTERGLRYLERDLRRPYRDTVRRLAQALALGPAETAEFGAAVERGATEAAGMPNLARPTLPAPSSPLVGREREVAEVAALLHRAHAEGSVRLLTLTGPGGVGKTRLALHLAHTVGDLYPDGAVFVALAPLRDPTLVLAAIAAAIGVKEEAGHSLAESVRLYLGEKRLLVLLDNFEHVISAAPLVADLLATCPSISIVATSRARLRLRGEHVYPVPPLRTPDLDHLPALAALAAIPAVALLVQRAQAAAPDFDLDAVNAPAVAALCARLDGLPLALELAAPRLTVLSPELLLRRLVPRLALLTDGARDLPERQRTLRATLDWSHALLGPAEQAALRQLSVFAGGCTLEAAEAVCALGAAETSTSSAARQTADLLGALIDTSLLQREVGADGELRFGLLETVREYGLESLAAAGERDQAYRTHALYFLALAEEAEPRLLGSDQLVWGHRLEQEHDNLRTALTWAIDAGDAAVGQRLAGSLWRFWSARGHLSEGRRWLGDALALSDRMADVPPAPAIQARALSGAAHLAIEQGAYDEADGLCARALALTREQGPRRDFLVVLNVQALLARECGRYAAARACYEEALAVARADADQAGVAAAFASLGAVAARTDDAIRARPLLEQSLTLYRALGDTRGLARVLADLTLDAVSTGAHTQAESFGTEALALFRALGDTGPISEVLFALGTAVQNHGEYERAEALYEESLSLHEMRGDALGATRPISALGLLWLRRGDVGRARALLRDALATVRRYEHRWAQAMTLSLLGHAELAAGAVGEARELFGESAALFQTLGTPLFQSWLLEGLAGVAAAEGEPRLAARLCGACDTSREHLGSSLPPAHPAGYVRTLATARAALGDDAFSAMWEEGRALAPEGILSALGWQDTR